MRKLRYIINEQPLNRDVVLFLTLLGQGLLLYSTIEKPNVSMLEALKYQTFGLIFGTQYLSKYIELIQREYNHKYELNTNIFSLVFRCQLDSRIFNHQITIL